ncbi:adenylate kinase [Sulfurimonas sp. HSL1-2]|uniref:adenylate kinase n=1 Tax=Thiomicrolovo zhangzhouensis TaxID=3131933 RepID=UPI0031F9FB0D
MSRKKLILIIGAPGSGKTTDCEVIASRHDGITHYSAGDMFRAEVATGSERGQLIKSIIDRGEIVPIDIAIETIVGAIKQAPTAAVIIDGYPRSIEQMEALDAYLAGEPEVTLANVIEVVVSEEIARDRVLGRARGADDNEAVFTRRMNVYVEPLADIQRFYTEKGLLHKINGERELAQVADEMQAYIESLI